MCVIRANFRQMLASFLGFCPLTHNHLLRENLFLFSCFKPVNWGLKKISDLLKIIKLMVEKLGFKPKSVGSQSLCPHSLHGTISHLDRILFCLQLPTLAETFCVCSVPQGRSWQHGTIEHLEYSLCDSETEIFTSF